MYEYIGNEVLNERRQMLAKSTMIRTYLYMFGVTILSGISACIGFSSGYYETLMNGPAWWIFFALELGIIFLCQHAAGKQNAPLAGVMLALYGVINGLTLSYVFAMFSLSSILVVFFIAAAMFLGLAIAGTVTKRDLSTIGTIGIMGLIGVILLSIVNIFVRSAALDLSLAVLALALFIGITAYDAQKIRMLSQQATERTVTAIAIIGALELYLDFINIFLHLLHLFGSDD